MDLSRSADQNMENCMIRPYGKDWILMMNITPNNLPCCVNRPLKTLPLFPITTTDGLKDQTASSSFKSVSLSFIHRQCKQFLHHKLILMI